MREATLAHIRPQKIKADGNFTDILEESDRQEVESLKQSVGRGKHLEKYSQSREEESSGQKNTLK